MEENLEDLDIFGNLSQFSGLYEVTGNNSDRQVPVSHGTNTAEVLQAPLQVGNAQAFVGSPLQPFQEGDQIEDTPLLSAVFTNPITYAPLSADLQIDGGAPQSRIQGVNPIPAMNTLQQQLMETDRGMVRNPQQTVQQQVSPLSTAFTSVEPLPNVQLSENWALDSIPQAQSQVVHPFSDGLSSTQQFPDVQLSEGWATGSIPQASLQNHSLQSLRSNTSAYTEAGQIQNSALDPFAAGFGESQLLPNLHLAEDWGTDNISQAPLQDQNLHAGAQPQAPLNTSEALPMGQLTFSTPPVVHEQPMLTNIEREVLLYRLFHGPRTATEAMLLDHKDVETGLKFQDIYESFAQFSEDSINEVWQSAIQRRTANPAMFNSEVFRSFENRENEERHRNETMRLNSLSRRRTRWTAQQDALLDRLGQRTRDWIFISSKFPGRTPLACRRRYMHKNPNYESIEWSGEEDNLLRELIHRFHGDTHKVADFIPDRSENMVRKRWDVICDRPPILFTEWTEEEDQQLIDLVARVGSGYYSIANIIPGRSKQDCVRRWNELRHIHKLPRAKANVWTHEEDVRLMELVREHGKKFKLIDTMIENRSFSSIKGRYNRLSKTRSDRIFDIKRTKWTNEEDTRLVDVVNQIGQNWSMVATHFTHRSPQGLKFRYFFLINRRRKRGID